MPFFLSLHPVKRHDLKPCFRPKPSGQKTLSDPEAAYFLCIPPRYASIQLDGGIEKAYAKVLAQFKSAANAKVPRSIRTSAALSFL